MGSDQGAFRCCVAQDNIQVGSHSKRFNERLRLCIALYLLI